MFYSICVEIKKKTVFPDYDVIINCYYSSTVIHFVIWLFCQVWDSECGKEVISLTDDVFWPLLFG